MTNGREAGRYLGGLGTVVLCVFGLPWIHSPSILTGIVCLLILLAGLTGAIWVSLYRYGPEPDPTRISFGLWATSLSITAIVAAAWLSLTSLSVGNLAAIGAVSLVTVIVAVPLSRMWTYIGADDLTTDKTAPARFMSNLPIRAVVRVQADDGASNGVIVNHDGLIVTTAHGTYGAKLLWVTLANGEAYPASLIAHSKQWDLALLKIEPDHPLPVARLASRTDLGIGDALLFLGFEPRRHAHGFSWGMSGANWRSALRELAAVPATLSAITEAKEPEEAASLVVATQATIRPGYSGCPVVLQKSGRIVGIHSGAFTSPGLMRVASSSMVESLLKSAERVPQGSVRFRMPQPEGGAAEGRTWEASAFGLLDHHVAWLRVAGDASRAEDFAGWRSYVQKFVDRCPDHPACVACQAGFAFLDDQPEVGLDFVARALDAGLADVPIDTLELWTDAGGDLAQSVALVERAFATEPMLNGVDSHRVHRMAQFLVTGALSLGYYERVLDVVARVRESAEIAKGLAPFKFAEGRALLGLGRYDEAITAMNAARDLEGSGSIDSWAPLIEAHIAYAHSLPDDEAERRTGQLTRATRIGLWCALNEAPDREVLELAIQAATELDKLALAQWFDDMRSLDLDELE